MSYVKFAFIADSDVFHVASFSIENPVANKWISAFRSNVELINVNNYSQVKTGFRYNNGSFYDPDDISMQNSLLESTETLENINRFAGVIENEIIGFITFVKDDMDPVKYDMVAAGMASNPEIIEINNFSTSVGWTWNGNEFLPPQG